MKIGQDDRTRMRAANGSDKGSRIFGAKNRRWRVEAAGWQEVNKNLCLRMVYNIH